MKNMKLWTALTVAAVRREPVSQEVMGVWIGFTKLTNAIVSAVMAIVAGVLYDYVGPM